MPDPNTPAPTATTPPPATPDFTALLHNGKIFGKYDTPEAAVKGFWELNNYAANLADAARHAQTPTQPRSKTAIEQVAEDSLLKPDLFAAAVAEVAERVVNARFAPLENSLGARTQLAAEIPDFAKNEPAVQAWLSTNPEINQLVTVLQRSGTPEGAVAAMRIAYREWQASQVPQSTPTPQAIAGAALPGGVQTGGPAGAAAAKTEADNTTLVDAIKYARATGDPRVAFSELFKDFPFFPGPEDYTYQQQK